MLQNLKKHIEQIKKGGIIVIIKKLRSFIYLLLQIPFYLISIPLVFIIRLMKPWYLVRWQELDSNRIGNYSATPELYCCEKDAGINIPSQRFVDFFYLRKYVCNKQLDKMWRRSLIILPTWLLLPLCRVNRFIGFFIANGQEHEIGPIVDKVNLWHDKERDVHSLIDKFPVHISFTSDEEFKGKEILKKFGVPKEAKFICLQVRDSAYLDRHDEIIARDWSYQNYRDGDIDKYVLAAEELANRGYYIFRMGVKVLKPLKSPNPKIIDYVNSGMRSDFMDIYLGAKCTFCISTGAGFDGIPFIFRKPITYMYLPLGYLYTYSDKYLTITKHQINKKNQKELTISEIFSSNVAVSLDGNEFKQNDVELRENSPEEIRDIVIEMDDRLNGNWKETKEDKILQEKFWSIFEENMKKLNFKKILHGKIKARFGAKYLRNNQDWIK